MEAFFNDLSSVYLLIKYVALIGITLSTGELLVN